MARLLLRTGTVVASLATLALGGCVKDNPPENLQAALYSPEHSTRKDRFASTAALSYSSNACAPAGANGFMVPPKHARGPSRHGSGLKTAMRYSPGDRINVSVFNSPEFTGDYVVNPDGTVVLAYAGTVNAAGLTNAELSQTIERAYVRAGLFTRDGVKLTVRPVLYAPVNVTVAGAVFLPGRYAIGAIKDIDKQERTMARSGDNPLERFVPAALRAAGGARPDADLSTIKIFRNGKMIPLDWRGVMTGAPVDDLPLIEGDHVQVEEAGCFQSALVRPSQITPPGIRISYSNLNAPSQTNAQSAMTFQTTGAGPYGSNVQNLLFVGSVPYGTRLLQGLVQANCLGGNYATTAHRHAVLISRNPKTMETEVIQRSVEELVRSADRDTMNPFLMPDDAIACYDSTVAEARDIMSFVNTMIQPAATYRTAVPLR